MEDYPADGRDEGLRTQDTQGIPQFYGVIGLSMWVVNSQKKILRSRLKKGDYIYQIELAVQTTVVVTYLKTYFEKYQKI